MPTVSIIMPAYNSQAFLKDSIESVLQQTFSDFELIIIDDGSTDTTADIANTYAKTDARILFHTQKKNQGVAVARNRAIEMANGRFIAFLDSDDIWLPDKLERQLHFMGSGNYSLSYTHYAQIDDSGKQTGAYSKPPGRLSYSDLLKSNQIGCLTAIYDSRKLGKIYMPLLRARQDYGLWLKILRKVDYAYGLNEVLALYRVGYSSVSSSKLKMVEYNWQLFREAERFSRIKSAYYLGWNIYRKLRGS